MKKVAITGGIGSGKSTALRILKDMGYPVYSCDEIYKEILTRADYVAEVERIFPNTVENGKINKEKLANEVFNSDGTRAKLNAIAHPKIMQSLKEKMQKHTNGFVFAEVPLLLEGNYQKDFDAYIVILRALPNRIASVCNRDGASAESVLLRIQAQYDYDEMGACEKLEKAGAIVIYNDDTEEKLKTELLSVVNRLL